MKSIKILLLSLFIATALASCSDDNVSQERCTAQLESPVTAVTGPNTGTVGQEITLQVKFSTLNGCYKSGGFLQSGTNPKQIAVVGFYEGCACSEEVIEKTENYKFTPAATGDYTFKFKSTTDTFITKTVTITQ